MRYLNCLKIFSTWSFLYLLSRIWSTRCIGSLQCSSNFGSPSLPAEFSSATRLCVLPKANASRTAHDTALFLWAVRRVGRSSDKLFKHFWPTLEAKERAEGCVPCQMHIATKHAGWIPWFWGGEKYMAQYIYRGLKILRAIRRIWLYNVMYVADKQLINKSCHKMTNSNNS